MGPLSEDDQKRLAKLLWMMTSNHDGEVLNAARMASRFVAGLGYTWDEVLGGNGATATASNGKTFTEDEVAQLVKRSYDYGYEEGQKIHKPGFKSVVPSNPWKAFAVECLDDQKHRLTAWEVDFCESWVERPFPHPTPKQRAIFERLADRFDMELPDDGF